MKDFKIIVTNYTILNVKGENVEEVEKQFLASLQKPADIIDYQIIEVEETSIQPQ